MKGAGRLALPLSAASLAFSAVVLPITYVAVPFCRPMATLFDLGATVGIVSAASALAFGALFLSLVSVYTLGTRQSRVALALSLGSLAVATAYIVFGMVLRTCPV